MHEKYHIKALVKALLIGDAGAGKTSFMRRSAENYFPNFSATTTSSDFKAKTYATPEKQITMQLWDLPPPRSRHEDDYSQTRGATLCFIVYDVTNPASFKNVPKHIRWCKNTFDNAVLVLIGSKNDCLDSKAIKDSEGQTLATNEGNMPFYLVSAKTGENVEKAVLAGLRAVCEKRFPAPAPAPAPVPAPAPARARASWFGKFFGESPAAAQADSRPRLPAAAAAPTPREQISAFKKNFNQKDTLSLDEINSFEDARDALSTLTLKYFDANVLALRDAVLAACYLKHHLKPSVPDSELFYFNLLHLGHAIPLLTKALNTFEEAAYPPPDLSRQIRETMNQVGHFIRCAEDHACIRRSLLLSDIKHDQLEKNLRSVEEKQLHDLKKLQEKYQSILENPRAAQERRAPQQAQRPVEGVQPHNQRLYFAAAAELPWRQPSQDALLRSQEEKKLKQAICASLAPSAPPEEGGLEQAIRASLAPPPPPEEGELEQAIRASLAHPAPAAKEKKDHHHVCPPGGLSFLPPAPAEEEKREDEHDYSANFFCPLTRKLMVDPVVVTEHGDTFERAAFTEWKQQADKKGEALKHPSTGKLLGNLLEKPVPNRVLKEMIQEHQRQQKGSSGGLGFA
jgi:Ras-related protein Rab-7A